MPIRGPGVMLSQFMGDAAPFDSLDGVVGWLAGFGYAGVQVPVPATHWPVAVSHVSPRPHSLLEVHFGVQTSYLSEQMESAPAGP